MKKTLIAMAVVAASGAAFAQSSVTLYGRVDTNVSRATGTTTQVADGAAYGAGASRFGFKGTEDLGGGLKAAFIIETGLNADNADGAPVNNKIGGRESSVALSSNDFGGVKAGRYQTNANLHAAAYSAFATDYGFASGTKILGNQGARQNNQISYISPSILGGLQLTATRGTKEADTTAAGGTAGANLFNNPISLRANYTNGPLAAGVVASQGGSKATSKTVFGAGASYNFGPATALLAAEADNNQVGGKNAVAVGVKANVGPALVRATVGKDKAGAAADVTQVAFGADYALSKRTALYAVYARTKPENGVATKQATFGVGHNF